MQYGKWVTLNEADIRARLMQHICNSTKACPCINNPQRCEEYNQTNRMILFLTCSAYNTNTNALLAASQVESVIHQLSYRHI